MSSLQDIPLADPEGLSVEGPEVAPAPKSNSLKRFFKISKKPMMRDQVEDDDETSSQDNKDLGKSNTISRFFTRMKGANKGKLFWLVLNMICWKKNDCLMTYN